MSVEIWDNFKDHEKQKHLSQIARLQQLSEVRAQQKLDAEYQQAARERARHELEQRQAKDRHIAEQRTANRKSQNEVAYNALLARSAQELQLTNQRQQKAHLDALQRLQERKPAKGNPMEDAFYEAWCKAYPDIPLIRQHHVLKYRLDFAHLESRTAIELDGHGYHHTRYARNKDYRRQHLIEDEGWHFIRFTSDQIREDMDGCVERVYKLIMAR